MGNKNKIIKVINSNEVDIKTKMKKNKCVAKDSKITIDISELSKKTSEKNVDRKKFKEGKNKKSSVSKDKEFDSSCRLEDDNTDSIHDIDKKIITKKKNKKRKLEKEEEIDNITSPKHKKIKTTDQEQRKQGKPKNKTNETDNDSATKTELVNKNKRKFLNEDEAEVKDEDIDKFCDELSEEDNNTYENWVKLFEANFKKNKNPS